MKLSKKSQRYLDNMMHTLQWIAQQKEDVKKPKPKPVKIV